MKYKIKIILKIDSKARNNYKKKNNDQIWNKNKMVGTLYVYLLFLVEKCESWKEKREK
jgi:hypothetical protein